MIFYVTVMKFLSVVPQPIFLPWNLWVLLQSVKTHMLHCSRIVKWNWVNNKIRLFVMKQLHIEKKAQRIQVNVKFVSIETIGTE